MTEYYIKVYEWLLTHPELTTLEALIVSHIIRWDKNGCYQSNAELGKLFKKHPRHIQRIIKSLVKRGWLAPLYPTKYDRFIWATPKNPPIGPLFDYKQKSMQAISKKTVNHLAKKL